MTASLAKVLPSVVVGTIAAVFSYDRGLNFSAPAAAAAPARGSPVATWLTGAPVGASFKDFVPPLASALGAQTDWCAPQFEVTLALDRSLVSVAFGTFLAVLVLEALRLLLFKSIFSGLFRYVGDARRRSARRRSARRRVAPRGVASARRRSARAYELRALAGKMMVKVFVMCASSLACTAVAGFVGVLAQEGPAAVFHHAKDILEGL